MTGREGFYRVIFSGNHGVGMALLSFDTGMIYGCDQGVGLFSGEYTVTNGELDFTVKVSPREGYNSFPSVNGKVVDRENPQVFKGRIKQGRDGSTVLKFPEFEARLEWLCGYKN